MTESGIFVVDAEGRLSELSETPFPQESVLQELLADHPGILAGSQIDPDRPRRWLLIDREMAVPDAEEAAGRWALDHLLLDQDGIPTLIEVKRSSDTRIRREVVGQMLDYASHAVAFWNVDIIRDAFEQQCRQSGSEANSVLAEFLEDDHDIGEYWAHVKTNLQAGRIRLLFVADRLPAELRRIIEFLNTQMDPATVLGVEVHQYVADGTTTIIPRVHGATERARARKEHRSQSRRKWDEESFFQHASATLGQEHLRVVRELYQRLAAGTDISWGTGAVRGSFTPRLPREGTAGPFSVFSNGDLWFKLHWGHYQGTDQTKVFLAGLKQAGFPFLDAERLEKDVHIEDWAPYAGALLDASFKAYG